MTERFYGAIDNFFLFLRFLRAVAYRWLARWLFGEMGWENTRPLAACVYHKIRKRFSSSNSKGYVSGQDRATVEWYFNSTYNKLLSILSNNSAVYVIKLGWTWHSNDTGMKLFWVIYHRVSCKHVLFLCKNLFTQNQTYFCPNKNVYWLLYTVPDKYFHNFKLGMQTLPGWVNKNMLG